MKTELSEKDNVIQKEQSEKKKLKEELSETHTSLQNEKNSLASMSRVKANLEEELSMEKGKVDTLHKEVTGQKELNTIAEKEINSLQSELESLKDLLAKEKAANDDLRAQLAAEKESHAADNAENKDKMEKLFNQAKLDLKAKQVVIKKLESTNSELSKKYTEDTEKAKETIHEMDRNFRVLTKKYATLEDDWKQTKTKADLLADRVKLLEAEKVKLTQTALALQETKRKFKQLIERYPKQEDLAKLLCGDISFANQVKDCVKHGMVQKQGGNHVNRWQTRYVVLTDCFLFYYGSVSDKLPKGLARIDGEYLVDVAKCDHMRMNMKKENGFTVVVKENVKDPKSSRPFYFSAPTEQDCYEWIQYIKQAGESSTYM